MKFLLLSSLLIQLHLSEGYNSYMIVCPDSVRPGMDFTIELTKLSDFPRMTLYADLSDEQTSVLSGNIPVAIGTNNAKLELKIPHSLPSASYTLEVSARDSLMSLIFKNSTSLTYMEKGMSIYIQTDKAIYKPGEKVQFRAFGANPDLSVDVLTMNISIYDPNNNKISQWLDVSHPSGVYQGDLQLSDQPPLGDWRIEVITRGYSKSMGFTVAEYVLPKFEVTISVPSFGVTSDKYLSGTINAKYTFGKGVEGNGTLSIKKKWYSDEEMTLSFKINGEYVFEIEISTLIGTLGSVDYTTLELTAVVEEGITGNSRQGVAELTYYNTKEKLVFLEGADNFKPGLKYTGYLYLSDQDDKPLSSSGLLINVTVTMYSDSDDKPDIPPPIIPVLPQRDDLLVDIAAGKRGSLVERISITDSAPTLVIGPKTVNVPRNGIVQFTFSIPIDITRIMVNAKFRKLETGKSLEKFRSTSGTYIQISLVTRTPQAGKVCAFKIQSTVRRIGVNYLIIAKGKIVKSGIVNMRKKQTTLKVTMTTEMAPSARCVVYWTRRDAEIIADSMQFNVEGIFQNKVEIKYVKPNGQSTKETQPGKQVMIKVTADPLSHCSVLAIDKSVLLLKSGNDITPGQVESELESYDSQAPTPCQFFPCWRSLYPFPVSGVDVTAIFQNSGLQVLTDAFLYQWERPFYRGIMPLMMMMKDSGAESVPTVEAGGSPRVRTFFPETWVYDTAQTNENGTALIKAKVPDTITSWVASAFAVNKVTGLGVAPSTANLNVFLKFFIRLDFPYSVIRGEQVILQANVFNFFDTEIEVEVVMKESSAFENIIVTRNPKGQATLVMQHTKITQKLKIIGNGVASLNLPIVPVQLGYIDIELSAVSAMAGDAVRMQLLVEPEGIERNYNIPVLIELRDIHSFTSIQAVSVPVDAVEGSVKIRISAIGDLMGPSISGLSDLLSMPYGCGEQNMIGFVPNIFVIKYLNAINNLKPSDENKAKGFMLVGYQRELTYQHYDGSFSAFGNDDPSGSTWLTAFVVKSFSQAKPYIYIDPTIMKKAIDWLLDKYIGAGLFAEPGHVIHTEMQGSSASGDRNLASYTLIALLEAKNAGFSGSSSTSLQSTINSVKSSLESAVGGMTDIFELAIASYALALTGSSKLSSVLTKLDTKATLSGGMKYWEVEEEADTSTLKWIPPHPQAKSRNIEATAYVLLAYAVKGDIVNGLKVIRWLVNQRNMNGGFGSTQDTVIALQALAEFGALIYSDSFNINIAVTGSPSAFSHSFNIVQQNALVLQSVDAPPDTTSLTINATGSGLALVEISVKYNVLEDFVAPLFDLQLSYSDETMQGFKLRVCFRWLGDGISGMAVLEIGLLSGFGPNKFSISDLGIMKRIEDGDKMLVIYLDEVTGRSACLDVRMQREGLVAGTQPAVVKLYDYYHPENHAFGLYQPELLKQSSVCDVLGDELNC